MEATRINHIEHLRHIRARVDQIADDVTDLKLRMSGLEGAMGRVKREVAYGDETDAPATNHPRQAGCPD